MGDAVTEWAMVKLCGAGTAMVKLAEQAMARLRAAGDE
jgi:hypothetical protein